MNNPKIKEIKEGLAIIKRFEGIASKNIKEQEDEDKDDGTDVR